MHQFWNDFIASLSKIIAVIVAIIIIAILAFIGFKVYNKVQVSDGKAPTVISEPTIYKPGKVISKVSQEQVKVNHVKIKDFTDSIDSILADYNK